LPDTPQQAKVRNYIRGVLANGKIPTPSDIQRFLYGEVRHRQRGGGTLPGRLAALRIQEFEAAGLRRGANGRWAWR
jgi:hypothetical protein